MSSIDYKQSPDEIMVALINLENDCDLTTADLELRNLAIAPDPISGRETFNNVRTALRVDAAPNSGYTSGVNITYNRINLRDVFPNNDDSSVRYPTSTDEGYPLTERVNLVDILDDINTKYGLNIQPGDIYDHPLPTFDGPPPYAPSYVRLEFQAGHKIFIGGVNLRILPNDWSLNNLTYVDLDGLLYPHFDPDEAFVETAQQIDDQFALLGTNGGWNYQSAAH